MNDAARRLAVVSLALSLVGVTATGCSTGPRNAADDVRPSTGVAPTASGPTPLPGSQTGRPTALSSSTTAGEGTASFGPGDATGEPSPTPVASIAGGLTGRTLPEPRVLGPGWRYRVAGTEAEDGFAGNGTAFTAIGPTEIVQTVLPFGCVRRPGLPLPRAALSVEFVNAGTGGGAGEQGTGGVGARAVAVRLRFGSAGAAATFVSTWHASAVACAAQPPDPVSGATAPMSRVRVVGPAWVSERAESDDLGNPVAYREWKLTRGSDVLLLAAQVGGGALRPDAAVAASLERVLAAR
ncbi:MAG: hypothetical protein ACTHMW_16005 [Actinomycetes bacterium]